MWLVILTGATQRYNALYYVLGVWSNGSSCLVQRLRKSDALPHNACHDSVKT